jgi:starch phosphorylase
MPEKYSKDTLVHMLKDKLTHVLGVGSNVDVPDFTYYQAAVLVVKEIEFKMRKKFWANSLSSGKKQVYYLSMEFLLGRSLKNCLYNLGIIDQMKEALATFDVTPEQLYEHEPDAGLGNGGLGRLAACYLDALANEGYLATGYCLRYEYGMFRQKIIDGWQKEETDIWLPGGEVWLSHKPGYEVEVRFGGELEESWEHSHHILRHKNYARVMAVPYDYNMPGYHSEGLSLLRLWRAKSSGSPIDNDDILAALEKGNRHEFQKKAQGGEVDAERSSRPPWCKANGCVDVGDRQRTAKG